MLAVELSLCCSGVGYLCRRQPGLRILHGICCPLGRVSTPRPPTPPAPPRPLTLCLVSRTYVGAGHRGPHISAGVRVPTADIPPRGASPRSGGQELPPARPPSATGGSRQVELMRYLGDSRFKKRDREMLQVRFPRKSTIHLVPRLCVDGIFLPPGERCRHLQPPCARREHRHKAPNLSPRSRPHDDSSFCLLCRDATVYQF